MIDFLIVRSRTIRWLAVLGTVVSVALLIHPGLKEDYTIESFVAADDPAYRTFRKFMHQFPSDEIAIIAVRTDNALSADSLATLDSLVEQVRQLDGVQRVSSLMDIPALFRSRLTEHPLVERNLLSTDHKTAAILLEMSGEVQDGARRWQTVQRLRNVVSAAASHQPNAQFILAGPYVTLIDMYDYLHRDLLVFSVIVLLLMTACLAAIFRDWRPVVVSMGSALCATLCTLGVAASIRLSMSLVTQMIVILAMILAVACCVHLAVAAREVRRDHGAAAPAEQARLILARMFAPCSAVSLTTMAGFGSVCISSLMPIRQFGYLMCFALLTGLVVALASVPVLVRTSPPANRQAPPTLGLSSWLRRLARGSLARRWTVIVVFAVVTIACLYRITGLKFESDFIKNFRVESDVRRSYRFLTEHLTPVGSMELVVRATESNTVVTVENLRTAADLAESIVADFPPIKKVMTLADVVTLGDGSLPAGPVELAIQLKLAETFLGKDVVRAFVTPDQSTMRINMRAIEGVGVHEKLRIAHEARDRARRAFGPECRVQVTGLYYFYAQIIAGVLRDQTRSFVIAAVAVFVMIALVLRSLRVALVAFVPNFFPVIFCLGVMGWFNIPINMVTAMMLSIALGIAVDDTIHYLWRFRRELSRTGDYAAALEQTHASVGRACVFTSVVIAGGFWILCTSQFLPTAYFGALVGLTMISALAADLVLLPVLMNMFKPMPPQPANGQNTPPNL